MSFKYFVRIYIVLNYVQLFDNNGSKTIFVFANVCIFRLIFTAKGERITPPGADLFKYIKT